MPMLLMHGSTTPCKEISSDDAEDFPYINPNTAALDFAKQNEADLYNAYMDSQITNPPVDAVKAGHRVDDVGEALPLYDQIWTEIKGR